MYAGSLMDKDHRVETAADGGFYQVDSRENLFLSILLYSSREEFMHNICIYSEVQTLTHM